MGAGDKRNRRSRPFRSDTTNPASSSASRCLATAWRLTGSRACEPRCGHRALLGEAADHLPPGGVGKGLEHVSGRAPPRDTDRDFILTAEQAKDYGVIDEVISSRAFAHLSESRPARGPEDDGQGAS